MKAVKYPKVNELPKGAIKISSYAQQIGQANPSYIHVMYDRYLSGKGSNPGYTIVNWQNFLAQQQHDLFAQHLGIHLPIAQINQKHYKWWKR